MSEIIIPTNKEIQNITGKLDEKKEVKIPDISLKKVKGILSGTVNKFIITCAKSGHSKLNEPAALKSFVKFFLIQHKMINFEKK